MIIYFVSSFQRLFMYMGFFLCFAHFLESHQSRPNILVILADDLGYGDLSVSPFTGQGIKTPELEKMALSGRILTNFHDAAPICTPTRASILTGLFPWRLGIYSIYGTGKQAKEQLSVVPNIPLVFFEAGYHTAHIGKWHLGEPTLVHLI
jgi:arylsulfatase A-like enzyme